MPEDIRSKPTVLSRLELLEEKLDDTVVDFCADREGEDLARNERTARTLAALLRECERMEAMKKKYDGSESGGHDDDESEALEALTLELKRKIIRSRNGGRDRTVAEESNGGETEESAS
ncbi:hypothetical protein [Aquisalinus flavus]|uniref:Uncharacterized protein n=1 Tax=Aquisalinus flavus TaxID=1526572 RepID=A0A8J2V2Z4_9PROT|nr:hypothetical protein [Aquisalinus flavus]GGD09205.1 hypothetical protein GCM10011342_17570 [Aquisalinus flavus]